MEQVVKFHKKEEGIVFTVAINDKQKFTLTTDIERDGDIFLRIRSVLCSEDKIISLKDDGIDKLYQFFKSMGVSEENIKKLALEYFKWCHEIYSKQYQDHLEKAPDTGRQTGKSLMVSMLLLGYYQLLECLDNCIKRIEEK